MERGHRRGSVAPDRGCVACRTARVGVLIATLLIGYKAEPASAMPQSHFASGQPALRSAGKAGPTPAWIKFCERLPQECAVDLSEPDLIALDQQIWDTIVQTNEKVNGTILSV